MEEVYGNDGILHLFYNLTPTNLKNKKQYYIPGSISLIVLPLIFFFFATREIHESTVRSIPLYTVPDTVSWQEKDLSTVTRKPRLPKRNYLNIVFTGDQYEDLVRLEFAQIRIREILKANDTTNGIHFLFTDSSSYRSFVGAVDKLRIESAKYYISLDNNLWFFEFASSSRTPGKEPPTFTCCLCSDVIYDAPQVSAWIKLKQTCLKIWQSSWQLVILCCGFIFSLLIFRRKQMIY